MERPLGVAIIDHRDVVGKGRQARVVPAKGGPIGAEMEFPVAVAEAVKEVTALEAGPAIEPDPLLELVGRGQAAPAQRLLDDLPGRHLKAGMRAAEPMAEIAQQTVVRA